MFFEPLPCVTRVVFIATPHRGSFRVSSFVLNLVRRLVTLPVTVIQGINELAQSNPNTVSLKALGGIPTAVDNMRPGQRFVWTLAASPLAPGVTGPLHHRGAGGGCRHLRQRRGGGVRERAPGRGGLRESRALGHSTQTDPETIQEVRRILREHVAGPADKPGTPVAQGR